VAHIHNLPAFLPPPPQTDGDDAAPFVIGISGGACAGKSTLAKALKRKLQNDYGFKVKLISQDRWYSLLCNKDLQSITCLPFVLTVKQAVKKKYDYVIVEGSNSFGAWGRLLLTPLFHLKIFLSIGQGYCQNAGRRNRFHSWGGDLVTNSMVPSINDVPGLVTYNASEFNKDDLTKRVLLKAIAHRMEQPSAVASFLVEWSHEARIFFLL